MPSDAASPPASPQGDSFPIPGRRLLVTGGNGFVGSAVVRMLVAAGAEVRCLLRAASQVERLAGVAFERALGDVRDADSVRQAIAGCDGVIHAAGMSSYKLMDSPEAEAVTVGGTRNVLEAARDAGVKKVVFVSSGTAINGSDAPRVFDETAAFELGNSGLRYAIYKHNAEKICLGFNAEGVPVVIVNPGEVYGPNDTGLITSATLVDFAKSSPVLVCDGGIPVTFIDDCALGIVRALERGRPGQRYILSGENLTVRQVAELTLSILGQKKRITQMPNAVVRGIAKGALALRIPLPFEPKAIPYGTRYWFFDSSKAQRELGVTFRSARETLQPTLAWLRDTGRIK